MLLLPLLSACVSKQGYAHPLSSGRKHLSNPPLPSRPQCTILHSGVLASSPEMAGHVGCSACSPIHSRRLARVCLSCPQNSQNAGLILSDFILACAMQALTCQAWHQVSLVVPQGQYGDARVTAPPASPCTRSWQPSFARTGSCPQPGPKRAHLAFSSCHYLICCSKHKSAQYYIFMLSCQAN